MTPREELLDGYRRPYRRAIWRVWKAYWVPHAAAGAAALAAVGEIAGDTSAAGAVGAAVVGALALRATRDGVRVGRHWKKRWSGRTELEQVRRARPHRPETFDPEALHPEFGVSVSDDGWLELWEFVPLDADAALHHEVPDGWDFLPGIPAHAVRIVERAPYDERDAARAAEQLAALQAEAARREAKVASAARAAWRAGTERAAELAGTAAALKRHTGQSSSR